MWCVGIELRRMRFVQFEHVAGEFDRRDLHAETQSEIGKFVFAGVFRRNDFAFDAALAKPALNQNAAESLQNFLRSLAFDVLGVHLHDFHAAIVGHAAVNDRFVNRFVGVLQLDVFADDANADTMLRRDEFADDLLPMRHVRRRCVEVQQTADEIVEPVALKHERHLVNAVVNVLLLDDRFVRDVAEQRDFLAQFLVERTFATGDQNMRRDADFAQFGDRLLRRLGLQFARRLDERDVGDVHEHHVAVPGFERELADGFEKRQAFDVAGRAADFGDDHVRLGLLGEQVNAALDFVGNVRDDLHGFAEVFTFALVVEHGLIDLAAGEVVEARQLDVGEPFVMAEVEIGFRAVVEHIDLAVLIRIHRTRIDV